MLIFTLLEQVTEKAEELRLKRMESWDNITLGSSEE
jgi:hypothetical protein